jgi:energy-coupling factor transporter ATP-binding protein EcfA2
MKDKKEISVFIASPGDVTAERTVVREICEDLNKSALLKPYGISFQAIGWEDAFPSPGRPQEIINRLVEECDIFVCIFHKRFGSPTGKEASGTLEEFLLAYDSWKSLKKPHIMTYFKAVQIRSKKEQEDPQLTKVLDLKDKIEEGKLLLFGEFSTTDDFRVKIKEHLEGWTAESAKGWEKINGKISKLIPETELPLIIPPTYKNWISMRCEKMDIDKLVDTKDKGLISLTLPETFIPLYAAPPDKKTKAEMFIPFYTEQIGKKTKQEQKEIEKGQSAVDIETLIAEHEYLLISGQAGSGKTTLLKYLAYTIVNDKNKAGLNGFLPIMVFLRDLPQIKKPANLISGTGTAEELLSDYFQAAKHGLTIELVKAYCKEKRAIFLIDGLDEIEPEFRKIVVESLATLRTDYHCNKMVLSGRLHGIDAAVNNQFGEKRVEINPLNLNQVELFIGKWCKFDRELQAKGKTSSMMCSEIKEHQNVEELITTPLMLTAACVLYHYDKKLPEQRADLYEKVISNLIHKRFSNPNEVLRFLMELAYEVHTAKQGKLGKDFDTSKIGFDKALALRVMETIFGREKDETKTQHELRLINEFDKIEQNCGLLRLEGGQYRFWHLTFQEFLMARKIAMFERDHAKVINEKYWDNDWFKEMIELFIGHLSNTANAIAVGIVEDKLRSHDSSPFRNWRLACNCLLDIHPDMRDSKVVKLAQECLCSIFEQKLEQDSKILTEAGEILGWLGDPRDLKEFVLIEGGEYDLEGLGKVDISPFEICKYPVTNQWYKEFVDAKGYEKPEYWSPHGQKWLEQQQEKFPRYWHERKWKCPNSPVVGISWYEAYAFCNWLTKDDRYIYRLPTEQEWQVVASGIERRVYPWDNGWDKLRCNNWEIGLQKTSPVGIFKKGDTPEGISDVVGNVWEWTDSWYDKAEMRVLRGGSWGSGDYDYQCTSRNHGVPFGRRSDVGFRFARTLKL